jgi:hypothetical protein
LKLAPFISDNLPQILAEWEAFASTLWPAADTLTPLALRDHAQEILQAVARDIDTVQTEQQRVDKSKGLAASSSAEQTAAATHGALRHLVGFSLPQLTAEYRALRASVLRLWMAAQASTMDESGFHDMLRFNEAIDQALAESVDEYAKAMARSRETFLAILAHDLRTPLAAVSMAAELLGMSGMEEKRRLEVAARIASAAGSMETLIADLLIYAKTRLTNGFPIEPGPCDFGGICEKALREIKAAYPERHFHSDIEEGLAGQFDAARLYQVFCNLLGNAVHHGATAAPIIFTARRESDAIVAEVKNFGFPIPPEALQVIFEPLVQLESARANSQFRPRTSVGLGLYIAKAIVSAHGGNIEVHSTAGEGTTFKVILPRKP